MWVQRSALRWKGRKNKAPCPPKGELRSSRLFFKLVTIGLRQRRVKSAVNDWPTCVDFLDAFLNEIRNFLKIDVLTFNTINAKIKKISTADFAWQLELLTSLMELIKQNKDEGIEIALNKIL